MRFAQIEFSQGAWRGARSRIVVSLLALAAVTALARQARACSRGCRGGHLLPDSSKTVPASADGVLWQPRSGYGTPSEYAVAQATLYRLEGGKRVPVAFRRRTLGRLGVLVIPEGGFVEDARYVLVEQPNKDCRGLPQAEQAYPFSVSSAASRPHQLGAIAAGPAHRETIDVSSAGGSCSEPLQAAVVDVELELHASAKPWRDLLVYRTVVDDQPWEPRSDLASNAAPGTSWVGRGRDRLYAACAEVGSTIGRKGLSEGSHAVRFEATLPGSDTVYKSDTVEVELSCGGGCSAAGRGPSGYRAPVVCLLLALAARIATRQRTW